MDDNKILLDIVNALKDLNKKVDSNNNQPYCCAERCMEKCGITQVQHAKDHGVLRDYCEDVEEHLLDHKKIKTFLENFENTKSDIRSTIVKRLTDFVLNVIGFGVILFILKGLGWVTIFQ